MTLLAAFQTLVYRYTGQTDIVLGTGIAGRNQLETEKLIGFFVNTLVLRCRPEGNLSFLEFLRQVREVTLGAYAHQDLPFERLVEALQPERDLRYTPLFQVMFSMENTPREAIAMPGLKLTMLGSKNEVSRFDLTFFVFEGDDKLMGSVQYNTALFDYSTVARMITHFRVLCASIVESPTRQLSELRLLEDAEVGGYTPLQFPDAHLSQQDFESVMLEINKASA